MHVSAIPACYRPAEICIYHHGYEWQQHIYWFFQKERWNRIERAWLCRRFHDDSTNDRERTTQVCSSASDDQCVTAFPAVAIGCRSKRLDFVIEEHTEHVGGKIGISCNTAAAVLVMTENFRYQSRYVDTAYRVVGNVDGLSGTQHHTMVTAVVHGCTHVLVRIGWRCAVTRSHIEHK